MQLVGEDEKNFAFGALGLIGIIAAMQLVGEDEKNPTSPGTLLAVGLCRNAARR